MRQAYDEKAVSPLSPRAMPGAAHVRRKTLRGDTGGLKAADAIIARGKPRPLAGGSNADAPPQRCTHMCTSHTHTP